MKLKNFSFLFIAIMLFSCGKKVDLTTEVFNISTYKATLEKAYADSTNKQNQEILLNFIDENLQGKIDKTSYYFLKERFESPKPGTDLTYANILNTFAKPYTDWKKSLNEFNTKTSSSLDLKLNNIVKSDFSDTKDAVEFEITNKGDNDIASIEFYLQLNNKMGEEIFWGKYEYSQKVGKGETKKFKISDYNIEKVGNMDLSQITKNVIINKVSYLDGTNIVRPDELVK